MTELVGKIVQKTLESKKKVSSHRPRELKKRERDTV